MRVVLVGFGGFVGAVLRYWVSGLAQGMTRGSAFPLGTLVVNVLGCLAIGVLAELAETHGFLTPDRRAFLVVGLLGGFTTFSAFANESVDALRAGAHAIAVANVILSVGICLIAVVAGRSFAQLLWR